MAGKRKAKKAGAKKRTVRDLSAKGRAVKVRGGVAKGLSLSSPNPRPINLG